MQLDFSHIDVTWNLFMTPIVVALSTAFLARYMNNKEREKETARLERAKEKDKKDAQIAELLAEKEADKIIAIEERWARHTKPQCAIKEKVEQISEDLRGKVTWERCDDKMNLLDARIRKTGG